MAHPAGGDIAPDAVTLQGLQIVLRAAADIGRGFAGLTVRVLLDALKHPWPLWGIGAVGIEMLGYDDLGSASTAIWAL